MDRINLNTGRFTQAQVLQMVPMLSEKNLQNWNDRKIIKHRGPKPGTQGKRLYTGLKVIGLTFMAPVVELGIGPSDAARMAGIGPSGTARMAEKFPQRALEVHADNPAQERDGVLHWSIDAGALHLYKVGRIYKYEGRHELRILNRDAPVELLPNVYVGVEVDFLILGALNRIYSMIAGRKIDPKFKFTVPAEAQQIGAELAKEIGAELDKYKPPGGGGK
jgi:hypothetical protein